MFDTKQTVIFVTSDEKRARFFLEVVECSKAENNPDAFFDLYRAEGNQPFVLEEPAILQKILDDFNYSQLVHTMLIMDYQSLGNQFQILDGKGTLPPLAELILMYPEVQFRILRDNHRTQPVFGLYKEKDFVRYEYLCMGLEELITFGIKLKSGIQLFDSSGIRNFLKAVLNNHVKTMPDNYQKLHESRKGHFALTVDEEKRHALFWGYALYNFGFSVLPVITSTELKSLKRMVESDEEGNLINFICRDYDLQFSDLDIESKEENQLCRYRGLMRKKDEGKNKNGKGLLSIKKEFWDAFFKRNNRLDKNGEKTKTWIISQVPTLHNIKEKKNHGRDLWIAGPEVKKSLEKELKPAMYEEFRTFGITIYENTAYLKGQTKEISGLMDLLKSEEVHEVFQESRDYTMIDRDRGSTSHHALPAVNLKITEAIMKRAKKAYKEGNYLVSALLASEALEIINGLSISLSLGALHLKSLAEAQMELNVVGIGSFKKVIKKKIYEIRRQIKRICADNDSAEKNARMQIFNQLRHIFEESQQFDTAEILYEEVIKAEFDLKDNIEFKLRWKAAVKNRPEDKKQDTDKSKPGKTGEDNKQINKENQHRYILHTVRNSFYTWYLLFFALLLGGNALWSLPTHRPSYVFMASYIVMFFLLLWRGKKLLFTIIGGGTNFKRFICTYILINFILVCIYLINNEKGTISDYAVRGVYSLISFLMNEPLKLHEVGIMPQHWIVLLIIFFHVLLSLVYLGVFIAAVYRWLTRR